MKLVSLSIALLCVSIPSALAQSRHDTPSDEDINLLVGQIDRAMVQYRQIVEQEEQLIGESADTATDTQLLKAWGVMKTELTKSPQKFNSFVGFDITTTVDDASRNAALISNAAALEALKQVTARAVTPKTDMLITLMQSASANSTLFFTISESTAELYRKFLRWQQDTFIESVTELSKCADLKKN